MLTRRTLLHSGAMMAFAAGVSAPTFFGSAARAGAPGKKVLVVVYQRFGMDGLIAVMPYANESLRQLRPNLMLPAPDSGKDHALIDLGEGYGLNPALSALVPLYREGSLAFIQAAGSPNNSRSHLDAAQFWESGVPGDKGVAEGWLNRAMSAGGGEPRPMRAVALTAETPRALYGRQPSMATTDLGHLRLTPDSSSLRMLRDQYAASGSAQMREAAEHSIAVGAALARTPPSDNDRYPQTSFGGSLRDIATLIKADVGLQVAFAESRSGADGRGSWDTHSRALDASYQFGFPTVAEDFSTSLAAFWHDLGNQRDDVVLVTHTDFGRNVVQNADQGCDHGRATTMMVLGRNIRGGVHGQLPPHFERDALEDQMDLPVTTDYRAVLAELAGRQLGIRVEQDSEVFPGFTGKRFALAHA